MRAVPIIATMYSYTGCVEGVILPPKKRSADRPPFRHGREHFKIQEEGRPQRRDRLSSQSHLREAFVANEEHF